SGDSFRKEHDIDLRRWEESFGRIVEEHQADIARLEELVTSFDDIQAPAKLGQWHLAGRRIQTALDVLEKGPDERQLEIIQFRSMANAVIKGNCGRQTEQLSQFAVLGFDCVRVTP